VAKHWIFTVLLADATVLRWVEPRPGDDSGSSLGHVAVGDGTSRSSCASHEQGFRIVKYKFIKIVAICSLGFLQSFIQVLILFLFTVCTAQTCL